MSANFLLPYEVTWSQFLGIRTMGILGGHNFVEHIKEQLGALGLQEKPG